MKNSCFYSSFVFLANVIICFLYDYNFYALLFFILFITSLIVHSYTNSFTLLIDKFSIMGVVLYGGYLFYTKAGEPAVPPAPPSPSFIFTNLNDESLWNHLLQLNECSKCKNRFPLLVPFIILTFLITIYLYYYGFTCKKYCFCEDTYIANMWHSFLHFVSFIGHGMIVLL
jgi:hypothetical protein